MPLNPVALALMVFWFLANSDGFADSYWQGGPSDFNAPGSWNPAGVPTGVNAFNDSGSNNVVLIQAGDPIWSPWDIRAGDGSGTSGSYQQNGSTNVVNGWFRLGDNTNAAGFYTLNQGTVNAVLQAHVGEIGNGVLRLNGGTFNVGQTPFCLGYGDYGPGGSGTLVMNGGTLNTAIGVDVWIGEGYNGGAGGAGNMILSGGSVNVGGWLAIGRFGGVGDLELSGGSITMLPGATGTFNLDGGDLFVSKISDSGGNGAFNFNGGTLHARANSDNFLQAVQGIHVQTGGAIINSEGCDVTITQALDGNGGLTKLGVGSLTFGGAPAYSGPTVVSNGTLTVFAPNAFASSSCTVAGGAAFGIALTSAKAQLAIPQLAMASTGGALNFDFAGTGGQTFAPLQVDLLAVEGLTTINVSGYNFSAGQYPLIQFGSRTGTGSFTLGLVPAGMTAQLTTNIANQSIDLVVSRAVTKSAPWQAKQAALMTAWASQVNPTNVLPEYPRPQMVRSNWMNLNGVWQFQPGATNEAAPAGINLAGTILVPFPMESALSGVMRYYENSWYRRKFVVPADWSGQRILLHFEAVNWRSHIYVNGQSVGVHTGGYDPFSFDITPYLNGGTNELIVQVYSPVDHGSEPRGKQTLTPAGIMFTSASGIWQTVWLEPVPASSINNIQLRPDIDNNRLRVDVAISGPTNQLVLKATAFDGTNQVSATSSSPGNSLYLNVSSPKLWSPTNPFLYNLQISLVSNSVPIDSIKSYFGMRKISLGTDNGFKKICLNNHFLFEFGPLDQGFWPDGVYTAPTDDALKSDLKMEKALGFNMVRKHIKVEPRRWYYWADKLGILVWQDMPSCNSYTPNPSPPPVDALDFAGELTAMVTNHWNSPAIISWILFNEGQGQQGDVTGTGQASTAYLASLVRALDSTRLINQASGWINYGVGDILDAHHYPEPECPVSASQAVVCGEFGGVYSAIQNHTWTPVSGAVTPAQATNAVATQFEALANLLPDLIQNHGLSAAVYTEISDVEIELGGLITFDRKILKPDPLQMQAGITALTGAPFPINTPSVPAPLSNAMITAGQTLLVTNSATDIDVPSQSLTWSLLNPPAGAAINATNGLVQWRPTLAQSPSTNVFTVVVTDSGTPSLSATQTFSVFVSRPAAPKFSSAGVLNGKFYCAIAGSLRPDYSIYTTTNLFNGWQLLLTTNPSAFPFQFTDPFPAGFNQRFYRVSLGP